MEKEVREEDEYRHHKLIVIGFIAGILGKLIMPGRDPAASC